MRIIKHVQILTPFAIRIYLFSLHLWWKYIVHFNYSLRFREEERNILKRYLLLWLKTSLSAGDFFLLKCNHVQVFMVKLCYGLCYSFSYLVHALPALFAFPPLVPGLTICRHVINTADYTSSQLISFFGLVAFLFSTFSLRFMHGNHLKNRVLSVLFFSFIYSENAMAPAVPAVIVGGLINILQSTSCFLDSPKFGSVWPFPLVYTWETGPKYTALIRICCN